MVAKTGRSMQVAARVRMAQRATVTAAPSATAPLLTMMTRVLRQAVEDLDAIAGVAAGADAMLAGLAVFDGQNLFDAGERRARADCGTTRPGVSETTISARANEPGRSTPPGLGTEASIASVRVPSAIAGLRRTTRP